MPILAELSGARAQRSEQFAALVSGAAKQSQLDERGKVSAANLHNSAPAAQMPVIAHQSGAKLVILNLTPTPHDGYADVVIAQKTGETLTKIVAKAKEKAK